jgi:hypothetical protein
MIAFRKLVSVGVCLTLLALALTSVGPTTVSGAGAPVQSVAVVNTGAQPVPVSGGVNVNNFPATQQVAGMVSVDNLPATQQVAGVVSVDNLPATQNVAGTVNIGAMPVIPFQSPIGQVFRANVTMNGFVENPNPNVTGLPGHRLVIEVVDFIWTNAEAGILDFYSAGGNLAYASAYNLSTTENGLTAGAHVLTKIYLDPGEKMQLRFQGSINGQASNGQAHFSGYFEP